MRDVDLRRALHIDLRVEHAAELDRTLFLDELGLDHGTVFVDVAVVNGHLHGYEIKSERDTLDRLPHQAAAYSSTLDFATLVVSPNHTRQAGQMVPAWWGMTEAFHIGGGHLELRQKRKPRPNPKLDPLSVARLLWRDEVLGSLERIGKAAGLRSKAKRLLYEKLVQEMSVDELRREVREALKQRRGWRSDATGG